MKKLFIVALMVQLFGSSFAFSEERGFPLSSSIWNTLDINVCWENISASTSTERMWVRNAVKRTWETYSDVQFSGWGQCTDNSKGIRIAVADVGPHVVALGKYLNGVKNGMALNFTYRNWSTVCQNRRQYCSEVIAIHEFGHALGFAHEHNRSDTPTSICTTDPQGRDGDVQFGAWDLHSVMNYCNPKWNGGGSLSETDIKMVKTFYSNNSYNQYGYNSTKGLDLGYSYFRQLADVNGDGYDDFCRFVGDSPNIYLSCNLGTSSGFSTSQYGYNSVKGIDKGYDYFRQLADVNGDGYFDYCRFVGDSPNEFLSCNLGTSTGFSKVQYGFNSIKNIDKGYDYFRQLADVNGDGKADYCRFVGNASNITLSCNLSEGSSFSKAQYGFNSIKNIDKGYDYFRQLADVNGDGKADYCRFVGNSPNIYLSCNLSEANGFSSVQYSYNSIEGLDRGYDSFRILADVNSDGKADYCRLVGNKPFIIPSCNLSGVNSTTGTAGFSAGQINFLPVNNQDLGYEYFRNIADVDGDNKGEYCRFVGDSPKIYLSCNTERK